MAVKMKEFARAALAIPYRGRKFSECWFREQTAGPPFWSNARPESYPAEVAAQALQAENQSRFDFPILTGRNDGSWPKN
jgi:hypothetical protein